jgi:transposase
LAPPSDNDHDCGWKAYAKHQESELHELKTQLAAVQAKLEHLAQVTRGHRSERRNRPKMPPAVKVKAQPDDVAKKRAALAELRNAKLTVEETSIPVPSQACTCPECGNSELRPVGSGKPSIVYDYVPGYFRKHLYRRQTLSCRCGYIVTAPPPERVAEKTRYAPGFIAHLAFSKCSNSIPQYRLEKEYKQIGVPISRSTMCSLFHRAAKELRPLYNAACALVPQATDLHADETTFRQLDRKDKKSFIWDFVTPELIVYCYAEDRSGETPKRILGDSQGRLVVDQHTGYNAVTKPGKRTRAGCLAHARRKIFENQKHPEAQEALDLIGAIYAVEHEAKGAGIVGTDAHLALRKERSRDLFARLLWWGRKHRREFEPKSSMSRAIQYLLKNRRALGCFLRFATIPPDNNPAEAGLRRVAMGRGDFLFVADRESGEDLVVLYTLVASCEKNEINPIAYLTDVLIRIQTHPASRIEELLPHRWKPPDPKNTDCA